ncbi:MAG: toxin-antitoxin system YwqK family antitoxin [Bacillota bacterium]|nr:toxin-antitoxin system YwqK family antitoxin [Bacillota bacterium]
MKRRLASILIVTLILTGMAGCRMVDWNDWEANTWASAQLASFLYYMPIRTVRASEAAINKSQVQAIDRIAEWTDQLVLTSQKLHGQLDRLEKPSVQLLGQLSGAGILDSSDADQILQHLAARRAFIDSLQTKLATANKQKAATPYEEALDQQTVLYLSQLLAAQCGEQVRFMLDLVFQIRISRPDDLTRRMERDLSDLESVFTKAIEPHLADCYRISWSISTAAGSLALGQDSRQAYCLDETAATIETVEELLAAYLQQPDYNQDLAELCRRDMDWLRSFLADTTLAKPQGSDALLMAYPEGAAASAFKAGVQPLSMATAREKAAESFASISLLDPQSVATPDFLEEAADRAQQSGYALQSNVTDWLQDRLEPDEKTALPAPAAAIADNVDTLYEVAGTTTPAEPDPESVNHNNAVRTLNMVREWQEILNDTLSSRPLQESRSFLGTIGRIFSPLIDIDRILDLAESRLGNLIGDRSDSDEIRAYTHQYIRQFIKDRLGNGWRELLIRLTETNAGDLIERYQSWFAQAGGRSLDQYGQSDVNALIDRLLGLENPAVHSQLAQPGPVIRPSDPVGTTGGSSLVTQPTGTQPTNGTPTSSDYFVTRLSIQAAGSVIRSSLTAEEILQQLFGWSDAYGDAADNKSYGWRTTAQTGQRTAYIHPHYSLEVSYDQTVGVAGMFSRVYSADRHSADYQDIYEPAGLSHFDLNRHFLKIEFHREGTLKSVQDFRLVHYGAHASAYLRELNVNEAVYIIRKMGGIGRFYTFRIDGTPWQERLYEGKQMIEHTWSEDGTLVSEAVFAEIDPMLYRDGKQYYLPDNIKSAYNLADLACFALNGLYQSYHANGNTHVAAEFVDGRANGLYQVFDDAGRLRSSNQLVDNIRHGDFSYYYESGNDRVYLKTSGAYENDRRHGLWTFYQENGKPSFTVVYEQGILNGPAVGYDEQGQVRAKGSFNQGGASELWEKFTNGASVGMVKPDRAMVWTHEMNEFVATLLIEWP